MHSKINMGLYLVPLCVPAVQALVRPCLYRLFAYLLLLYVVKIKYA